MSRRGRPSAVPVRLLAAVAVAAVPVLAGCGGAAGSSSGETSVVASFYPLQYVAERVAGEHVRVENLTAPGAEPHDLELTVQQTITIADADVAFYQEGFQPAVDEALEQNPPEHVVEVTDIVALAPSTEGAPEESAEEHGHAEDEEHAHEEGDPHFWLDPTRLSAVAAGFAEAMAEADPDHAADYRANLGALRDDLATLDQEFRRGLADCQTQTVVVSHDAFGYLGRRYGLDMHAIAGLSPDAEPSPGHLKELHELIESDGVTTVFSETLASKEMAQTLARDLDLRTAVLDPVEGLSDATADKDYLSLMRANLAALQKANGCS